MSVKPLADRMRPTCFDEIAGQEHLVGKGGILRRLTENGRIPNMIFFGPPGVGKTTVANIIAEVSGMQLFKLNATTAHRISRTLYPTPIISFRKTERFYTLMRYKALIKSNSNPCWNLPKTVK